MSPNDDVVICTPTFDDDCNDYGFAREEVETIKKQLALNPELGVSISFAEGSDRRLKCAQLRSIVWMYTQDGALAKGHVLYLYINEDFPIFLLRLEIDDGKSRHGPFDNPQNWTRWAERIVDLIELALRELT